MSRKTRPDFYSNMLYEIKNVALKEVGSWGLRGAEKGNYVSCLIAPYTAENFGEDCLTPQGLPDGDTGFRERIFFLSDDAMVDIFGEDLSEKDFCCMDFVPEGEDQDWGSEDDEMHDDGVDFHRAPIWAGGRMSFYLNPHRKMKVRGRIVNRFY